MPKLPLKIRELILLSLPCALLLIGSVWLAKRQSGPWRTELVTVEGVQVTPLETWQGFNRKVRFVVREAGGKSAVTNISPENNTGIDGSLKLVIKHGDKTQIVPIEDSTHRDSHNLILPTRHPWMYNVWSLKYSELELYCVVNLNAYPRGANIRLQGNIYHTANSDPRITPPTLPAGVWRHPRKTWLVCSRPIKVDIDLSTLAPTLPPIVPSKITPKVQNTSVYSLSPRALALDNPYEGDTWIHHTLDNKHLPQKKRDIAKFGGFEILNERGQTVDMRKILRPDKSSYLISPGTWSGGPTLYFPESLPVLKIPASHGELYYHGWVSYNDSWPLEIKHKIREGWRLRRAKQLRLTKAFRYQDTIEVSLKYTGKLGLETSATGSDNLDAFYYGPAFLTASQFPENARYPKSIPGRDRLISDWSQRLVHKSGKTYWEKPDLKLINASCLPDRNCTILYDIDWGKLPKAYKDYEFRADIGLEGDGFIPVTVPLKNSTG